MDASSSTRVTRFHDPNIAPRVRLLQFLIVTQEVAVLVRQDVCVRHEIKRLAPKLLLHFDIIEAKTVFARDFIRMRKMVESLKLVEALVEVRLTTAACPEQVPLVRLSVCKTVGFAKTADKLGVTLQDLVKQFAVVDMVTAFALVVPVGRRRRSIHQKLRSFYTFEVYIFIDSALRFSHVNVLQERRLRDIKCAILIKEILRRARLPIVRARNQQRQIIILNVSEERKKTLEQFRPLFLVNHLFWFREMPFFVANI